MKNLYNKRWKLALPILVASLAFFAFIIWLISFARSFADPSCSNKDRTILRSSLPLVVEWTVSIDGCFQYAPLSQSKRVIGRTNSALLVFDGTNGKEILKLDAGAIGRSPNFAKYGNLLVFSSDAGKKVNTLNVETLTLLWSDSPGQFAETGALSTGIDDYGVYVASGIPGRFYAYEPTTGKLLWYNPNVGGTFGDILAVQDDLVYVLVINSLLKLDKKTGRPIETIRNKFTGGQAIVGDDTVYQFHTSRLTAQNLASGETIWELDKPAFSLALLPDRIIVAAQSNQRMGLRPTLYSLDKQTGQVQWQRTLEANPVSNPVAIGQNGYLMLTNASILAFNLENGVALGALETNPAQIGNKFDLAGLTTDGESLYATFGDKFLYKFGK